MRVAGEDGGQWLAEMAQRDLDCALQLLADRAQYITGASGAAIALRRDGRNDMLCRASTGSNAPELGALLSTEFGLSGESVRTRRALRCDDAERDARVNREVCRQLGIASVVVMPVVNDDQVLGVFELFSGEAHAFGERDVSAVQRLSEMVETAVRLAHASDGLGRRLQERETEKAAAAKGQDGQFVAELVAENLPQDAKPAEEPRVESDAATASQAVAPSPIKIEVPHKEAQAATPVAPAAVPAVKKPLFWSAALSSEGEAAKLEAEQSNVPAVLRGLRKCEACGFPVSAGRTLCVECEEKKWRGQLRPQGRTAPNASPGRSGSPSAATGVAVGAARSGTVVPAQSSPSQLNASSAVQVSRIEQNTGPLQKENAAKSGEPPLPEATSTAVETTSGLTQSAPIATADFVLSAAVAPSQSWLAANKYILGVLIAIALVAAAVYFLR